MEMNNQARTHYEICFDDMFSMKSFADLIRLQMRLEYGLDESGLLTPRADSTEQSWFTCYQGRSGTMRFYRRELPGDLRERLASLADDVPFEDRAAVEVILGERLGEDRWIGRTAVVPGGDPVSGSSSARLLERRDLKIVGGPILAISADNLAAMSRSEADPGGGRPVAGAFVRGQLVSICESVRENEEAAEAWVRTLPDFRREGFARRVVAIWATAISERGKVPFYSYSEDNRASRALLQRLGGHEFARVVAYA